MLSAAAYFLPIRTQFTTKNLVKSDEMATDLTKSAIRDNKITIFSKSYCPYCTQAKNAIKSLGYEYHSIELDLRDDGSEIQSTLLEMTGQRTVPNIFVNGKHIGGCDNTLAMIRSGKFQQLVNNS